MDDERIVEMIWNGQEQGVDQLNRKYGKLMESVARNILPCVEDVRETVNDALLQIWNAIPPARPADLKAYSAKIVRNLAINRWKFDRRAKRDGHADALLSELEECLPARVDITTQLEHREIIQQINTFLYLQPETARNLFICRYFFGDGVEQMSRDFGLSKQQISDRLYQTRKKLKAYLIKEGVAV